MILIFICLLSSTLAGTPSFNAIMSPTQTLLSSNMQCLISVEPGIVVGVPMNIYQPGSFVLNENLVNNLETFYNYSCSNLDNNDFEALNIMISLDLTHSAALINITSQIGQLIKQMQFGFCASPVFIFNFYINSSSQLWSSNPQVNIAFWVGLKNLLTSSSFASQLQIQVMTEIESWTSVFGPTYQNGIFGQHYFCLDYQDPEEPDCQFGGFVNGGLVMDVNTLNFCDISFDYVQI